MTVSDYIANKVVDIKDTVAYTTFDIPLVNRFTTYRREHEIYSGSSNKPRSYVRLRASTKQGLKSIATAAKQDIKSGRISTKPKDNYSDRGFLRWYRQTAKMKLSKGVNMKIIDTNDLVSFLESVEKEFP
jgi:hypothetical protein